MDPGWAKSDRGRDYVGAIREIVCYLHQGYLMPGGMSYGDMYSVA
jgi:hypothetical protein